MAMPLPPEDILQALRKGTVIPAHPLALNAKRQWDPRRQRALTRYYLEAGAGGIAIGVHTTQFAIRDPKIGLYQPLLEFTAQIIDDFERRTGKRIIRIAGIAGKTEQAVREGSLAARLGYHAGLLSLAALPQASIDELIDHCRRVAEVIPLMGFYLQEAVGGRPLPYPFWRRLCEIDNLVAIKVAAFNRYHTLDVLRAVADSGRAAEIALYTGNDDHIVLDLLTPFRFETQSGSVEVRFVGGLLGQWAVWTKRAVELLEEIHAVVQAGEAIPVRLLVLAHQLTDANAAIFDAANGFRGVIAGVHEVLRRQGLLEGRWLLDPDEDLGPGQMAEIDRVYQAYPHLNDDDFVREHLDRWLAD
ncbi:MAG: dihydrodipicolinate synthase family protein [candidate division KSB1 bacterium]|nr:dihydrodipicolinate synthase family protein [candidate division KSB1 bacterium]